MPTYTPGKVVLKKESVPFDNDAWEYIARVETADGQILEQSVRNAITNFVIGCKADGIWTAIKASCILAGARTLAGALAPLAGTAPTNNNFVSGDYNRKTGLVGDGSSKSLNSNRLINSDPQDNCHLSAWISQADTRNNAGIYPALIATQRTGPPYDGNALFYLPPGGTLVAQTRANTETPIFPSRATTGFAGASRASSTQETVRGNGTSTVVNSTSIASQNNTIWVFNYGNETLNNSNYTNGRLAFYSIGESLNLAQLDTRVTTLINAFAASIP